MTILFASGDVGGARSLLPVIRLGKAAPLDFAVLQHGFIMQECPPEWPAIPCPAELTEPGALGLLQGNAIRVLVFASSLKDPTALRLARAARGLGLPVIHVLDNWTNYRRRLETDGRPTFIVNMCEGAIEKHNIKSDSIFIKSSQKSYDWIKNDEPLLYIFTKESYEPFKICYFYNPYKSFKIVFFLSEWVKDSNKLELF